MFLFFSEYGGVPEFINKGRRRSFSYYGGTCNGCVCV